ncbi:GNAT family N-acetyltransferase [Putridiphycobacter roseus]|uniref:GNAT family N-acetyltransferase n=1 Tax=Putridiphycobacter roseus TaxID=2219161 RepID=A0A2W1NRK2_9FLAO|nr:GNAT family N-acetyltransferase [Putridiphycobacter roseus]PZE18252.1 GNAT family N-acetyltransferase [Putridiphycobacter roseus]
MNFTKINVIAKAFNELTNNELYDLLALRTNVFVVEQNCPYPELDYKDQVAIHVLIYHKNTLIAVSRILPPNISYPEVSIGRVATAKEFRGNKIGYFLMENNMAHVLKLYGKVPVRISAQSYLQKFYEHFLFKFTGKSYLEDGIPHLEMLYIPKD